MFPLPAFVPKESSRSIPPRHSDFNMATLKSKSEMYEKYHAGAFGNMLKAWPSISAFINDNWDENKPVALRLKTKPGIAPHNYCVPILPCQVLSLMRFWADGGIPLSDIVVNEVGPDDKIILQGEIQRSERHYDLRFSRVKKVMRLALEEHQEHRSGFRALLTVGNVMDFDSQENLQRLFDEYPDSVIEFSTYSMPVGTLQLNTVFWEVRNY